MNFIRISSSISTESYILFFLLLFIIMTFTVYVGVGGAAHELSINQVKEFFDHPDAALAGKPVTEPGEEEKKESSSDSGGAGLVAACNTMLFDVMAKVCPHAYGFAGVELDKETGLPKSRKERVAIGIFMDWVKFETEGEIVTGSEVGGMLQEFLISNADDVATTHGDKAEASGGKEIIKSNESDNSGGDSEVDEPAKKKQKSREFAVRIIFDLPEDAYFRAHVVAGRPWDPAPVRLAWWVIFVQFPSQPNSYATANVGQRRHFVKAFQQFQSEALEKMEEECAGSHAPRFTTAALKGSALRKELLEMVFVLAGRHEIPALLGVVLKTGRDSILGVTRLADLLREVLELLWKAGFSEAVGSLSDEEVKKRKEFAVRVVKKCLRGKQPPTLCAFQDVFFNAELLVSVRKKFYTETEQPGDAFVAILFRGILFFGRVLLELEEATAMPFTNKAKGEVLTGAMVLWSWSMAVGMTNVGDHLEKMDGMKPALHVLMKKLLDSGASADESCPEGITAAIRSWHENHPQVDDEYQEEEEQAYFILDQACDYPLALAVVLGRRSWCTWLSDAGFSCVAMLDEDLRLLKKHGDGDLFQDFVQAHLPDKIYLTDEEEEDSEDLEESSEDLDEPSEDLEESAEDLEDEVSEDPEEDADADEEAAGDLGEENKLQ
ncbi:unnamed protein product [Amoebophrya sp. A120]|nr:unnamed protein product [Amoebophrya sp. A120]|eukprot:GSA120T00004762001.1